ncbi:MAG: flagellar motor switch protein FliM [Acidimicrobiia bacterium]
MTQTGAAIHLRSRPHRTPEVQTYDFRRPNKFSREYVRALQIAGETFARQFSTVLGTALRAISSITLISVEQQTYDEHVRSLGNPSYLAVLSLEPLSGAGLFHLEIGIAMAIVERLLGGSGATDAPTRALTEIEEQLVRSMTTRSLKEFDYAFESLATIESTIVQQEANPQFAQITAPSDMVVVMSFDIKIGETRGHASICVPFAVLQPVLEEYASSSVFSDRNAAAQAEFAQQVEDAMHEVPLPLRVCFDPVVVRSAELLTLAVGDVVPLHHPIQEPLTATVGDVAAFKVVAGRQGKRLGCMVVEERSTRA